MIGECCRAALREAADELDAIARLRNSEQVAVLVATAKAAALREAADAIQALHPGEVKQSVLFLRARADASTAPPATHEYRPAKVCECGQPMSNPVHEMHPEDPPHEYKQGSNSHSWWGTTVCTWLTGDGYRQCSRPAAHPIHAAASTAPPESHAPNEPAPDLDRGCDAPSEPAASTAPPAPAEHPFIHNPVHQRGHSDVPCLYPGCGRTVAEHSGQRPAEPRCDCHLKVQTVCDICQNWAAASTAPPAEVDRYRAAVEAVKSLLPDSPPFGHVRVVDVWDALHDVTEHECADASTALPPPAGVVCVCAQHGPHPVTDHVYIPSEIAAAAASTAPPADVCPECRYEKPPHTGLGEPVPMPGMTHSADCPTLPRLTPEAQAKLNADLAAISDSRRRAQANAHNVVIGAAASAAPPADGPHE